jgi:dTDP-6-deoxy-L-talose 4-dehydrogenase (NAD+)
VNILITGAQGFVGQHLLVELNKSGHCTYPSSRSNFAGYLNLDVQQPSQMLSIFDELEIEVVVNLAWHTSGLDYRSSPVNNDALAWNRKFFKIVRESSIRKIVSVGSSAEYTVKDSGTLISNEIDWLYATSKAAAHRSFVETFNSSDIDFIWLRLFQVYGPGQSSQRFIPTLCDHIRYKRLFSLSNPHAVRDWIDVRDVAISIRHIVERAAEREMDIGTSHGLSNLEICNYAREHFDLNWELATSLNESGPIRLVADQNSPSFKYFKPSKNLFDFLNSSLS